MTTLFRKYRPQTFSSLVGQDIIVQTLTNELKNNSIAQSYLFYGPRGTGKTTTARLLAKAINCTKRASGTYEPCDTCASCTEISAGRNVDVIEIDAASQTGVDNVRENIIENAQFKPTSAKHKIFIIDEVHMLSTSAFNALLKTLEEPPAHIVFILATTELHKLPATIVSRCQRFTFKKIPHDTMLVRLQKICSEENLAVEPEVLERIIGKSDGCLRDAESLLGQVATLTTDGRVTTASVDLVLPASPFAAILELLQLLSRKDASSALSRIIALTYEGLSADYFLTEFIEAIRLLLHLAITKHLQPGARDLSVDQKNMLDTLVGTFTVPDLTRLLDLCLKRRQDSRFSPVPELPLELIIAEYCFPSQPTAPLPQSTTTPQPQPQPQPQPLPQPLPLPQKTTQPTYKPSTPTASVVSSPTATYQTAPPATTPVVQTTETTAVSTPATASASLEELRGQWKQIIEWVGKKSHSLTFILNTAHLAQLNGERLTIIVPYDFHREKLSEAKNKKLLEQGISEIAHATVYITCETNAATPKKPTDDENANLDSLAASFGGEVVSS